METIKEKHYTKPKIWVANLAEYNCGNLVGEWIAPSDYSEFEDYWKAVKKATRNADEIAVFDYELLPSSFGEYPDHQELFDFVHAVEESHLDLETISKFAMATGAKISECLADAEESYCGEWNNFGEYAEEYATDCDLFNEIPEHLQSYFDWESYARTLEHDYTVVELSNYSVAIFRDY